MLVAYQFLDHLNIAFEEKNLEFHTGVYFLDGLEREK